MSLVVVVLLVICAGVAVGVGIVGLRSGDPLCDRPVIALDSHEISDDPRVIEWIAYVLHNTPYKLYILIPSLTEKRALACEIVRVMGRKIDPTRVKFAVLPENTRIIVSARSFRAMRHQLPAISFIDQFSMWRAR